MKIKKKSRRINPWKHSIMAPVPNWLMTRKEVSSGGKLCYARLCQYAGKNGKCFPRVTKLAKDLGLSERQTFRFIQELIRHGLIETQRRGLGKTNLYFFLEHPWMRHFLI